MVTWIQGDRKSYSPLRCTGLRHTKNHITRGQPATRRWVEEANIIEVSSGRVRSLPYLVCLTSVSAHNTSFGRSARSHDSAYKQSSVSDECLCFLHVTHGCPCDIELVGIGLDAQICQVQGHNSCHAYPWADMPCYMYRLYMALIDEHKILILAYQSG